jgi:hypothetical protein
MARYLRGSQIRAEMASLESLLSSLHSDDIVGKIGLESRLQSLSDELALINEHSDTLASTALYFGGAPVIGSSGIDADFASKIISKYQDLVIDIWSNPESESQQTNATTVHNEPHLHVTALLHGSMGFLIEELEPRAVPLFPTSLKQAVDRADDVIVNIGVGNEATFEEQIESLDPPTFNSARHFFTTLHRFEASLRVVDTNRDATLYREDVDRAFVRLEDSSVEERVITENGLLVGIIPHGGRFEFQMDNGVLVTGKVASNLSEAYLKRLETEQAIGRRWKATIKRREVKRFNRSRESYKLMDLQDSSS